MLQPYFEFITDDVINSGIALAGGGARATMGSCGAFSGALMALSSGLCPRSQELTDEELEELEKARTRFYKFRDWFIRRYGGVTCSNVQWRLYGRSFNLSNDKEREELAKRQKRLGIKCDLVIAKVAVKAMEMLARESSTRTPKVGC